MPGEFGVAAAPERCTAKVEPGTDLSTLRQRMKELGVVAYQATELPQGGWRFVCDLRTAQPGHLRRIETGPTTTETEAIALAIAEAGRQASRDR